jgi:hypothetical protein
MVIAAIPFTFGNLLGYTCFNMFAMPGELILNLMGKPH